MAGLGGRVLIEVADIRPENNIRINAGSASAHLLKPGLYDIDSDHGQIRVFDGIAAIKINGRQVVVKGGHKLDLKAWNALKVQKFDKRTDQDDFYRWPACARPT